MYDLYNPFNEHIISNMYSKRERVQWSINTKLKTEFGDNKKFTLRAS